MLSNVPKHIQDSLKGEPVDFIVQSKNDYYKHKVGLMILIGMGIFTPILVFLLVFSIPLIQIYISGSTEIIVNGQPQTYTKESPWGAILFAIFPILFSLIFILPLLSLIRKGIIYIHKKGHWYAGTNDYLIEFNDNSVDYYKWSEFENTYNTKTNKNSMDIILTLKKNKISSSFESNTADDLGNNIKIKNVNINVVVNGKQVGLSDLKKSHKFFRNKIGLLGLENGQFVLNMIKHNMERYHKA